MRDDFLQRVGLQIEQDEQQTVSHGRDDRGPPALGRVGSDLFFPGSREMNQQRVKLGGLQAGHGHQGLRFSLEILVGKHIVNSIVVLIQ